MTKEKEEKKNVIKKLDNRIFNPFANFFRFFLIYIVDYRWTRFSLPTSVFCANLTLMCIQ